MQATSAQGILPDDDDYLLAPFESDTTRRSVPGGKKSLLVNGEWLPVPDQGNAPICSGCAIATAVSLKHLLYCERFCDCNKQPEAFSTRYIYNQVRDDATGLVSMKRALDTLVSQGICPAKEFPNHLASLPNAAQLEAAVNYKCWLYKRIFRLRQEFANDPDSVQNFQAQIVKKAIIAIDNNRPVIVGLAVTPDFGELTAADCHWSPPDPLGMLDWHAMLLVGYDDLAKEFILLNSYGTSWGCGGTASIAYGDFGRVARYGYELRIEPPFGGRVPCKKD